MPANLISVPSLHSELLQSTALTPTYHKSRALSMVIGIVAGIAVPGIGGALAESVTFLSRSVATAMVGAGVGAATAAIAGGDPLYGALAGGASGYIAGGGYDELFGPATADIGGAAPGGGAVPAPDGNMLAGGGQNVQVASLGGKGSFPLSGMQLTAGDPIVDSSVFAAAAQDQVSAANFLTEKARGGTFRPTYEDSFVFGYEDDLWPGVDAVPEYISGGGGLGGGSSVINANVLPDNLLRDVGLTRDSAGNISSTSSPPEEAWKFSDLLPTGKDIAGGVVGGLRDLMVHGLTEAGQQPPPQTREEAGLREGRDRALEAQLRLQGKKEGISDRFMAQARTISPLQRGQQQFALAQERLGRAQQAGLRRLGVGQTGAREAMIRRNALDRSRLGSEFPRGYQSGQRDVERLMTQGLAALPTGSPMYTSAAGALEAAKSGYARQGQEDKNRATWLAGIAGVPGVLSAEEREKRRRKAAALA